MKTITSKTKPSDTKEPYVPLSDDGYNYLWQLTNLGTVIPAFKGMTIIKDGFARSVYAGQKDGVESRVKNTLADFERKMGIERGTLKARILARKFGDYDTTQSAENFFHSRNGEYCIKGLIYGFSPISLFSEYDSKKTIGGTSEFYNMPVKTAKGKFANAWRKINRVLGLKGVQAARARGQFGYPVGGSGIGDEEPSL
tara:strand:- start:361 stop:954 length:594 start_codon:yes stop_codon:yes gene_type:complete